ncbi:hypothetical protein AAMO2058_000348300 [Amorphochlora amoebiformis]
MLCITFRGFALDSPETPDQPRVLPAHIPPPSLPHASRLIISPSLFEFISFAKKSLLLGEQAKIFPVMRRTVARIRLLAFFLFPVATAAASVTINNPSFEASSGWEGLVTGTKLYFAPPDGLAYASVDGGVSIRQNLSEIISSSTIYNLTVWTRSVTPKQPKLTTMAKIEIKSSDGTILASKEVDVSPPDLKGAPATTASDDGANIWISGGYRIHYGPPFFYQKVEKDPIEDSWEKFSFSNDATAPAAHVFPDGKAYLYGTYNLRDMTRTRSRIERIALSGTPPQYVFPAVSGEDIIGEIYDTVLSHHGDQVPWVVDGHLWNDTVTGSFWLTWGGQSCWITELDPTTGKIKGLPSGYDTEFTSHSPTTHTRILANQRWVGTSKYPNNFANDAPETWQGDSISGKNVEGASLFQKNGYYYACASYGSANTDYTIRCCRSTNARGPYKDKDEQYCTKYYPEKGKYGASILLGDDSHQCVPGHPYMWEENEKTYLGYDYRPYPPSTFQPDYTAIRRLYFHNGWPTVWVPVTISIDSDSFQDKVGQSLSISLSNPNPNSASKAGFDHLILTKVSNNSMIEFIPKESVTPTSAPTLILADVEVSFSAVMLVSCEWTRDVLRLLEAALIKVLGLSSEQITTFGTRQSGNYFASQWSINATHLLQNTTLTKTYGPIWNSTTSLRTLDDSRDAKAEGESLASLTAGRIIRLCFMVVIGLVLLAVFLSVGAVYKRRFLFTSSNTRRTVRSEPRVR